MAQTQQEIFDEIIARKDLEPGLSALSSVSATAIYRLWAWVISYVLYLNQLLWDDIAADLNATALANIAGTTTWYALRVQEWQNGDLLELIDNVPGYAVENEALQIADFVSVRNGSTAGSIEVKVAKDDGSGSPTPLTAGELASLEGYLFEIKIAGTEVNTISADADEAIVTAEIFYNPQVDLSVVRSNVEAAIVAYLSGIDFDGTYRKSGIVDAIQSVAGVEDVDQDAMTVDFTDYLAVVTNDPRRYVFTAGHGIIDPANPLSGTLTFTQYTP